MTYKWQEDRDLRLKPGAAPTVTPGIERFKAPSADGQARRLWELAKRQKAGEGAAPPRRFSWEDDQ